MHLKTTHVWFLALGAVGVVLCGLGIGITLSGRATARRTAAAAPPPAPGTPDTPPEAVIPAGDTPPPATDATMPGKKPGAGPSATGKVICIDPGHPSETSDGAKAPGGPSEIHVNWIVSQKLRARLEAAGYSVVMTKRDEKEYVTNRHRAEIANEAGAALFIRLHCDWGPSGGFAVYYPDQSGKSQGVTGPSEDVRARSKAAARLFHGPFAKAIAGSLNDRGVQGDSATAVGGKQGALTGSVFSKVPVLTVEMVCLNSKHDVAFVSGDEGIGKLAAALKAGIDAATAK